MNARVEDIKPWYRQFWPWFLILLPGSVVVAGFTTLYIAVIGADTLVVDNYFKEGLAINQSLEQDKVASRLSLRATVRWDKFTGEILVDVEGELDDPAFAQNRGLALRLLHPTDSRSDRTLPLDRIAPGHYRANLDELLRYRYYLRLVPQPLENWRLNGEITFAADSAVLLESQ